MTSTNEISLNDINQWNKFELYQSMKYVWMTSTNEISLNDINQWNKFELYQPRK